MQALVLGFCSSGHDFAIPSSRLHLAMQTLGVALRFVGNYALCGLSPQTDGMPVIHRKSKDSEKSFDFFLHIILNAADYRHAHRAASAAQVAEHHIAADLHAVVAVGTGGIAAITGTSLLVPDTAALQLVQQGCIGEIIRLEGTGDFRMFQCDGIVSDAVIGDGTVIIPLGRTVFHIIQYVQSFLIMVAVNIIGRSTQM